MKVFWWQNGLHIQPEDKAEDDALMLLVGKLKIVEAAHEIGDGTVRHIHLDNHDSIVAVNKLS
jgi:hypothetical protein